jgi:hypothetical protein
MERRVCCSEFMMVHAPSIREQSWWGKRVRGGWGRRKEEKETLASEYPPRRTFCTLFVRLGDKLLDIHRRVHYLAWISNEEDIL